jgi:hypothetical protein
MRTTRALAAFFATLALFGNWATAQTATNAPPTETPHVSAEENNNHWAFTGAAYTYFVPDSREYVQPTFSADRQALHLEARYNYENLYTGSAWLGYNLSGGEKMSWDFTPMLGGVFGNTTGIAPGYKGYVSWWKLELSSEGEYVFDVGDSSKSFFYNWSELSLAPVEWFRFGLVAQRTQLYQSDREIQRGVLLGIRYRRIECTAYMFNPDESKPIYVLAFALSL